MTFKSRLSHLKFFLYRDRDSEFHEVLLSKGAGGIGYSFDSNFFEAFLQEDLLLDLFKQVELEREKELFSYRREAVGSKYFNSRKCATRAFLKIASFFKHTNSLCGRRGCLAKQPVFYRRVQGTKQFSTMLFEFDASKVIPKCALPKEDTPLLQYLSDDYDKDHYDYNYYINYADFKKYLVKLPATYLAEQFLQYFSVNPYFYRGMFENTDPEVIINIRGLFGDEKHFIDVRNAIVEELVFKMNEIFTGYYLHLLVEENEHEAFKSIFPHNFFYNKDYPNRMYFTTHSVTRYITFYLLSASSYHHYLHYKDIAAKVQQFSYNSFEVEDCDDYSLAENYIVEPASDIFDYKKLLFSLELNKELDFESLAAGKVFFDPELYHNAYFGFIENFTRSFSKNLGMDSYYGGNPSRCDDWAKKYFRDRQKVLESNTHDFK